MHALARGTPLRPHPSVVRRDVCGGPRVLPAVHLLRRGVPEPAPGATDITPSAAAALYTCHAHMPVYSFAFSS